MSTSPNESSAVVRAFLVWYNISSMYWDALAITEEGSTAIQHGCSSRPPIK
jgi:hypothetical protein